MRSRLSKLMPVTLMANSKAEMMAILRFFVKDKLTKYVTLIVIKPQKTLTDLATASVAGKP